MSKTLTVNQTAELLGIHHQTVRTYIANGTIQAIRYGRKYLIPAAQFSDLSDPGNTTSKPTSSKEGGPTTADIAAANATNDHAATDMPPKSPPAANVAGGDFPNDLSADTCPRCGRAGGEYTPTLGECAFCSSLKETPATVPGQ